MSRTRSGVVVPRTTVAAADDLLRALLRGRLVTAFLWPPSPFRNHGRPQLIVGEEIGVNGGDHANVECFETLDASLGDDEVVRIAPDRENSRTHMAAGDAMFVEKDAGA